MSSFKIYGIWPQASKQANKHTPALPQCSHASVGLTQARPNKQCTYHCSLHSLPHAGFLPHSAAIKFHSITYTPACHTDQALLVYYTASAYKTDHICHAQYQLPTTMHLTLHAHQPSTTQPTAFATLLCTQLTKSIVSKMAQNVGMV